MAKYLRKYVGTYRVLADYDLDTKDFPRDELDNFDPSFDDLYIPCKDGIKIRHGVGNILSCYIPKKGKAMNVFRKIYQDNINEKLPEETVKTTKYLENLCTQLVEKGVLISAEILDGEGYFEFKTNLMDYIAKLVGAKTRGADISPFSVSNLPKTPYKIPEDDLKKYKIALNNIPKINMGNKIVPNGTIIKELNLKYDNTIKNILNIDSPIKDRKSKGLKYKEYIHSIGLWDEYCKYIGGYNDN